MLALAIGVGFYVLAAPGKANATASHSVLAKDTNVSKYGELDCNGFSPIQRPVRSSAVCTDIRGFANVHNAYNWDSRFFDNGHYIGHDEPDMTFNSSQDGSGGNVTWTETIGREPTTAPTVDKPGHDSTHWFQLTVAPWLSMAMCDSNSYPQLPCTPNSDANAPSCTNAFNCNPNSYPGAGSAFMEMQFYPPGDSPFADNTSCDNTHWCAALTIDSLECTYNYANCNTGCEEPVNFAFIQTNGVPTGPPSPQLADLATETPNSHTMLINAGDKVVTHMWDAPVPGGGGAKAFKVTIDDLTTHKTGSMQASAANGFQNTSITNCSGTPYNFQPEYNTAKRGNIIPWAALQTNISTEFETGHFEGCTSLSQPLTVNLGSGVTDKTYGECHGPYENAGPPDGKSPETTDAYCYPKGDTHGSLHAAPDLVTGCDDYVAGGDLDFDGQPYYPDWPTGASPTKTWAGSFVFQRPTSNGKQYGFFYMQTDIALSESTCGASAPSGCSVPPKGPGNFYPYWSESAAGGGCAIEFGNVASGPATNDFGKDSQYGSDLVKKLGYNEFEGRTYSNNCQAKSS